MNIQEIELSYNLDKNSIIYNNIEFGNYFELLDYIVKDLKINRNSCLYKQLCNKINVIINKFIIKEV